ncbi:MAG TPA: sigma-54 dependent transcriptional regulator [Vicinamibacterales bacterium]|nr:sigma-54 dependent transcriptional regulator [Vicinamibacterales bacterium]
MTGQPPLLIVVDDDQGILEIVERLARRNGFEVVACAGGMQALAELSTRHVDIALVDLRMPDLGGLDVIRAIRDMDPRCQAVLMTGFATVDTAVEAIKLGALDYLSKPLDLARLERLFTDVRDDTERRRGVLAMESEVARRLEFCGMVGRAPAMQELFGTVRRLAPHVRTALVTGETGTGKELVARALHRSGPRADKRFVTVSCSAVIESLFDGEVFGYVRGAVSGAAEDRAGLFELADGGTLFLDEVGELPQSLQAKLLRVLETGEITRVGSVEARHVDLHVIASSNRDLRAEVAAGRFRSDLYYRLNVVEIKLPPLRDRRADIPYLTAAFVRETNERLQKSVAGLTPAAERLLASGRWDGNVRELRNVIERACILVDGELISERELAVSMPTASGHVHIAADAPSHDVSERDLLATVERDHIQRALVRAGGNKKAAAKMLGLSRRALYRRLERLDLSDTITRRRDNAVMVEA